MTRSRQAEAVFDASSLEACRQALLRLQGIIGKRQWDKLAVAEQAVVQSMDDLKSQTAENQQALQSLQSLSRLQRNIARDLSIQMQMNVEDQNSIEQGMKNLKRLSNALQE